MNVSCLESFKAISDRVASVFEDIETAESEIAEAQRLHPEHSDRLWGSFKLLRRTGTLTSDVLYKAHIQELLERVMASEDTRPATRAEMLGVGVQVSAQMKMNRTGIRTVVELVDGLQVKSGVLSEAAAQLRQDIGREEYAGHSAEIIGELRTKLAVADRLA